MGVGEYLDYDRHCPQQQHSFNWKTKPRVGNVVPEFGWGSEIRETTRSGSTATERGSPVTSRAGCGIGWGWSRHGARRPSSPGWMRATLRNVDEMCGLHTAHPASVDCHTQWWVCTWITENSIKDDFYVGTSTDQCKVPFRVPGQQKRQVEATLSGNFHPSGRDRQYAKPVGSMLGNKN